MGANLRTASLTPAAVPPARRLRNSFGPAAGTAGLGLDALDRPGNAASRPAAPPRTPASAGGACMRFLRTLPLRWRSAESVFGSIHRQNASQGEESAAGPASSLEATSTLRCELPRLLADLHCDSLLDAPCGDLWWMKEAPLPIRSYCGIDIVEPLIAANRNLHGAPGRTFLCLDLRRDPLPEADSVLCRDCLVHFSFRDALAALANFRASGATWLLATTFADRQANQDALTGEWRPLNLQQPPFSFPPPLALLDERYTHEDGRYADKSLGLWRLSDLPAHIEGRA